MKIPGGGALQRQLMRQMQRFQEDLKAAQEELEQLRFEASAGGGAVTAVSNGQGDLIDLHISPDAVDPNDVEMLQDLVLAAIRESLQKSREAQEEKLGGLTGGLGIPGLL